jgi:hypothetical protein
VPTDGDTIRSKGRLRYSPKLDNSKKSTKWWLVIDADPELGRYYRQLYCDFFFKARSIQRPAWAEHISVIRDEEPPNKVLWERHDGQEIEFTLIPKAESDGVYIWFPVVCEEALQIREALGLPREPFFPLHLTIGNNK